MTAGVATANIGGLKEKLKALIDRKQLASLEVCVRCGICTESCHYYRSEPRLEHTPFYRAEQLRKIYRHLFDPVARRFHRWFNSEVPSDELLRQLAEIAFSTCTLCQRCTLDCPFSVDTADIMRAARALATATGNAPEMLVELADAAIAKGENIEVFKDYYLDQVKELEKHVQDQTGSSKAAIPVGKEGARILYVPLSGAHTIVPQAVLFNLAQESWTLSLFETSNYAYFLADASRARRIAQRIVTEAEQLKVEEVVITECGHGYPVMRWEVARWLGRRLPFRVRSIIEVLDEYLRRGALRLNPRNNGQPLTYHDSCNLGRKGGLFEEPRRIIRAVAHDYREMNPNRIYSFCCGAGSGLVAIPEWADIRLKAGKLKAEQIRQTGARIVVTSCDNCRHQIGELSDHYGLNIRVTSLSELVVEALA
jgi:Fe-S oxidoreductase